MRLKPGWYLLFLTLLYAVLVTYAWQRSERRLAELAAGQGAVAETPPAEAPAPEPEPAAARPYVLPLPGACLPKNPAHLPGAPRPYRDGVSYGFVFTGDDACVPVVYGAGVVAANAGEVVKADRDWTPPSREAFEALVKAVAKGASPEQMDRLRGREVWIRHPDGRVSVYAHLSGIAPWVRVGARVERGDWIGNVGNSGTGFEAEGSRAGARLLFELWRGGVGEGSYFGQGLEPEAIREEARAFFAHLAEE
ncbi:MAG TPA: M23 family metallopeptidase [Oceanithermus sp.]|nr:M23 family metallopeptidase [Oceanithermus sp.]